MYKLRRILAMLLVIVLMTGITSVFAQGRYGLQTSRPVESNAVVTGDDGVSLTEGTWVYGIRIFADAANSFMGVYNADTLGEMDNTTVKDEIGEATQYDTAERMYAKPVYYSDGVAIVITTGVGFIIYGPEP